MKKVGKVDYFDGNKGKLFFFVEDENGVEEEGFYKVENDEKVFYIFVTSLCEMPLDSELRARYSKYDYAFDTEERYLLYAQATILLEYRKGDKKKIIGYKTIPRHNELVYVLETHDFDILGLPKLDFAHVRSGSHHFDTKAGFRKEAYITHWLLCGWTNSGKTNAAKVLLNVTIKGDGEPFAGGVVIDPHGEYYQELKHFNTVGAPRVIHYTVGAGNDEFEKELKISYQNIYPSYLTEVYEFREDTQVNFMNQCVRWKGRKDWIRYLLDTPVEKIVDDFKNEEKGELSPLTVMAVKNRLNGIFKEDEEVWTAESNNFISTIVEGVTRGNWYIIDVSSIGERTTKVITAMIAKSIFSKYKSQRVRNYNEWKKYKPAGILVEEAHNYLSPEETGKGNVIAKIAKEGRKFHVFTIVVEQDPGGIDHRILKQIHNKVILQLIPSDARVIAETTPYVNELEKKIPYYSIGEGLFVSTGSFNFALPVKFPRISEWIDNNIDKCKRCGKPTMSITGLCLNCQNVKKNRDISAFM
ncbi:MAG: ATP-binding protein [Candidatus Diapherotrites archaeon]|nr:ATP-binding protein [Candidatus Diapherotrites archaeon]